MEPGWPRPGHCFAQLHFIHSRALPLHPPRLARFRLSHLRPPLHHGSGRAALQLSLRQLSRPFFLLHKITERKRSDCRVARYPASRPSCSGTQLARRPMPSRWPACPPPSPVSRCGPSAAGGAIEKQRPKMNYPISSSSLMNK